eukprot:scaffold85517_cov32-Tisochrysis_lutea.AAC.2
MEIRVVCKSIGYRAGCNGPSVCVACLAELALTGGRSAAKVSTTPFQVMCRGLWAVGKAQGVAQRTKAKSEASPMPTDRGVASRKRASATTSASLVWL